MSVFLPEKQAQAQAVSALLVRKVRQYFVSEDHRKEFEIWYERQYGKKYQWKKVRP